MLALAQSYIVANELRNFYPEMTVEIRPITTSGDTTKGPLASIGGKGLFTKELEDSLCSGTAHIAVHSAKDLPAVMDKKFTIAAVLPRGDVRDALITAGGEDDLL